MEKQRIFNFSDTMENREKIIQMLENPLVSGYGIEKMPNGRLYSANYQRYKKTRRKRK